MSYKIESGDLEFICKILFDDLIFHRSWFM